MCDIKIKKKTSLNAQISSGQMPLSDHSLCMTTRVEGHECYMALWHTHCYMVTDTWDRCAVVVVVTGAMSICAYSQTTHRTSTTPWSRQSPLLTAVSPDQAGPSALLYIYFHPGLHTREEEEEDLNSTGRWARVSSSGTLWLNTSPGGLDGWVRTLWWFFLPWLL